MTAAGAGGAEAAASTIQDTNYKDSGVSKKEYLRLFQYALKAFPRHSAWSMKPLLKSVIGVGMFTSLAFFIDYKWFPKFIMKKLPKAGLFLFFYLFGIFALRAYNAKTLSILIEWLWGCNLSITVASLAMMLGRPFTLGVAIALVGLDQSLWYADILSFCLRRKYVIGVAGYLSHPEQTYIRSLTSFHHLWFLPYCMFGLYFGESYLHPSAFLVGMSLGCLSMLFGRFLAPKFMWVPLTPEIEKRLECHHGSKPKPKKTTKKKKKKNKRKTSTEIFRTFKNNHRYLEYLNINCGWEFYPTISIKFIHYFNRQPWYIYIPVVACQLSLVCGIPFFMMRAISKRFMVAPAAH